ncbi:MAG: stage II sporulation protein D [Erysipelotrichaceae bacterium]
MKTFKLLYVIILLIITILLYIDCVPSFINNHNTVTERTDDDKEDVKSETSFTDYIVEVSRKEGTVEIPLETYLEGVVGSEMPASYNIEALKAQAIAARTFVANRGFKVDDSTASQVYHDPTELKNIWKDEYDSRAMTIKQAVNDTTSLIMTYNGEYISALFYSSCNGKTNNSQDYWKGEVPYLISVESPWDLKDPKTIQTIEKNKLEVAKTLGFSNIISNIAIERYDNGYVKTITMDNIQFSGREVREKLKLRSSDFTIIAKGDNYEITTKGYGHGVGMSQVGAQGMALDGHTYTEILEHYYSGINIEKLVYKK